MIRLPDYDRHADGNVFLWILRTAEEVRADRRAERLIDMVAKKSVRSSSQAASTDSARSRK